MAVILNRAVFAQMILEFLEDKKLTYREAAKELGIGPSTFTRIMQHKSISVDTFVKLLYWMEETHPNALNLLYYHRKLI